MNFNYQQYLARAQQLLQQGQAAQCLELCQKLLKAVPGEVNALHLSAMTLQQLGKTQQAAQAFDEALKSAPTDANLLVSYAGFMMLQGRSEDAENALRKACTHAPGSFAALHALTTLLFRAPRLPEAAAEAKALTALAPENPASWELAAAIAQKAGDVAHAMDLCRQGLSHSPDAPRLHYSLAQLLRQDCDFEASAEAYAQALRNGFEAPDLYRNRADALMEAGETDAALDVARTGVKRYPANALLQRTAARLHFSNCAPGDPVAQLQATAEQAQNNPELWQTLVELLKRLEREDEASAALAQARARGCPDTPGILALEALDAAWQGNEAEAIRRFERLLPECPKNLNVRHSFLQLLLSADQPERADAVCAEILARDPVDQMALAYRGTAWQMLGDPRESWLLDYQRMVVPVEVPLPPGFDDRATFFHAMREVLEELHHTKAQPIEQSVRGGTQTNGFLFRLRHPLLAVLEQQIRLAIVSALATFPDDREHPFWSRRNPTPQTGDGLRFSGAWSVRLADQGYHSNHIHPQGWVSSALYISLPEEVQRGSGTEGHIQFGTPMRELGIKLAPRRIVKPSVGTLVLFPSYMWHGTLPFHSDQPRITVAFDLLPQA